MTEAGLPTSGIFDGERIVPIFTDEDLADRFRGVVSPGADLTEYSDLTVLLDALKWLLAEGVQRVAIDPHSTGLRIAVVPIEVLLVDLGVE